MLATQNPFEFEGTYPLPENQLDRFMLCIEIGYSTREVEKNVLTNHRDGEPVDHLGPVLDPAQLAQLQKAARNVRVDDSINDYMLDIVTATRTHEQLPLGVSTRGVITLYRAAQALALVEGRNYVIPDDVKRLAIPALAHRIVVKGVLHEGGRERRGEHGQQRAHAAQQGAQRSQSRPEVGRRREPVDAECQRHRHCRSRQCSGRGRSGW